MTSSTRGRDVPAPMRRDKSFKPATGNGAGPSRCSVRASAESPGKHGGETKASAGRVPCGKTKTQTKGKHNNGQCNLQGFRHAAWRQDRGTDRGPEDPRRRRNRRRGAPQGLCLGTGQHHPRQLLRGDEVDGRLVPARRQRTQDRLGLLHPAVDEGTTRGSDRPARRSARSCSARRSTSRARSSRWARATPSAGKSPRTGTTAP